ncbi:MAG: DUF58 domain-containing protein [Myxococcota bacterium]
MSSSREILASVRRIELATRRAVRSQLAGQYHSAFKGQGMAFADVRKYVPGDDVRRIDWNVSARDASGALFIKTFLEERELTVLLVVDGSGSATFGTQLRTKRRVLAELGALLAFSALQNNDRVGLLRFTDRVEQFVPPRKGRQHGLRVIRDIVEGPSTGRGTSIRRALETLNRGVRKRAVVFILSDFQDEGFEPALRTAARRHDLVAIRVQDPAERALPPMGLVEWVDLETGERMWMDLADRRTRSAFEEKRRQDDARSRKTLHQLGIDTVNISTGQDLVPPLVAFFERRRRRLR